MQFYVNLTNILFVLRPAGPCGFWTNVRLQTGELRARGGGGDGGRGESANVRDDAADEQPQGEVDPGDGEGGNVR